MYLTFRQLNYFVHIVDAGSMTRAGDILHLAPTALSFQVKAMEDQLGVTLLHRHSRGVRVTEQGVILYDRGRKILSFVQETERLISAKPNPRTVVQLGLLPSITRLMGIDVVLAAADRLPDLDFRLWEGSTRNQITNLRSGELQFAVVRGQTASDDLGQIDMIEEQLVFVTAPKNARPGRVVSLDEVLDDNLVFYREGSGCWQAVHDAAEAKNQAVSVAQIVGSASVLRSLVMQGRNTAILPFGIVEKEAQSGLLIIHEIVDKPIWQRISLTWMKNMESTLPTGDIIEFVKGLASELDRRTNQVMRTLQDDSSSAWHNKANSVRLAAEIAEAN